MKPQLREVRRLPAQKTVVALFVLGHVKPGEMVDLFAEWHMTHGLRWGCVSTLDVYHEYWREEPYVRGGLGKPVVRATRIKRCRSTDEGAYLVTAIDLKKWSRGRRLKEAAK